MIIETCDNREFEKEMKIAVIVVCWCEWIDRRRCMLVERK